MTRYCFAALAFVLYLSAVFSLPQVRNQPSSVELSAMAAAVSHVKFGTQIGQLYGEVFDFMVLHMREPIVQLLDETVKAFPTPPTGPLYKTTRDGNGVGYPVFATAAFMLFGIHAWALPAGMLTLMLVSAILLVSRFPWTGIVVVGYFTTLILLLFTVMVFGPVIWGIPIGGLRYFSVVGILPLFHILLEMRDQALRLPYLFAQSALLFFVGLARGVSIGAFMVIAAIGLLPIARKYLIARTATIATAIVLVTVSLVALVPHNYVREGRFAPQPWHRLLASLGVHPDYPWPGVKEMFPCEQWVPGGVEGGWSDKSVGCVWFAYLAEHHIDVADVQDKTWGGEFNTVARDAFFSIAQQHPWQTLETFLIYKPMLIPRAIMDSLKFDLSAYSPIFFLIPLASIVLIFFCLRAVEFTQAAWLTLMGAISTLPAYFVGWAIVGTAIDITFYCLFAALMLMAWLIASIIASRRKPAQEAESRFFWRVMTVMALVDYLFCSFWGWRRNQNYARNDDSCA